MYICDCCDYSTTSRYNYNIHLKTNKHQKNIGLKTYTCLYCKIIYKRFDRFNQHVQKCILKNKDNEIEQQNKELKNKDNEIEQKNKELKNKELENTQLKTIIETLQIQLNSKIQLYDNQIHSKIEKLDNQLHAIKDVHINLLQKTIKTNTNNTQIIINNYPNAPNLSFPDTIKADKSLQKYIHIGGAKGIGQFIYDHWGGNISPHKRSIWLVDASRNKFIVRYENAWVIDIDGEQFQEINLQKIQNIFKDYLQKYNDPMNDRFKTIEFMIEIKTKQMVIKGLKEAGKYLIYDKEKFTDFEQIEGLH